MSHYEKDLLQVAVKVALFGEVPARIAWHRSAVLMVAPIRQICGSILVLNVSPTRFSRAEKMNDIRNELQRLINLNHAEQWVPDHIALKQLQAYGDGLMTGLIECLGDKNAEIRLLAVGLLDEAGQRAEPSIPDLIQAISDSERLVGVAAVFALRKFGLKAAEMIPVLKLWLHDGHSCIRLLAAVTIIKLDPERKDELLPIVQEARNSTDPMFKTLAEEIFV